MQRVFPGGGIAVAAGKMAGLGLTEAIAQGQTAKIGGQTPPPLHQTDGMSDKKKRTDNLRGVAAPEQSETQPGKPPRYDIRDAAKTDFHRIYPCTCKHASARPRRSRKTPDIKN